MTSIIIPYRDRESHLKILLPALVKKFEGTDFEVIISEQDDDNSFRIAAIENIGYQYAKGDVIILHQVDYIPHNDVSYEVNDVPVLPARRGIFVMPDMSLRPIDDIPAGYRNWGNEIRDDFHGGVIAMKRQHFEKIGGLNPLIKNWGTEDTELGLRLEHHKIPAKRNTVGTFYCLYHKDNNPELKPEDKVGWNDFVEGREILNNFYKYKDVGYKNLTADVEKFEFNIPNCPNKGIWLKSKNYEITI